MIFLSLFPDLSFFPQEKEESTTMRISLSRVAETTWKNKRRRRRIPPPPPRQVSFSLLLLFLRVCCAFSLSLSLSLCSREKRRREKLLARLFSYSFKKLSSAAVRAHTQESTTKKYIKTDDQKCLSLAPFSLVFFFCFFSLFLLWVQELTDF